MPEPTPVPDAAEVRVEAAWVATDAIHAWESRPKPWPIGGPSRGQSTVDALLAHGKEHGVTIRPDRKLVPASPDASLSPAAEVLAEWGLDHKPECQRRPGHPFFAYGCNCGLNAALASLSPAPGGLDDEWRARFRQIVVMAYAYAEHMEETDRYDADWFNSVTRPLDRLSASPAPLPDDEEPRNG